MSEKLSTPVVLALPAYEELDEGDPGLSGWRMPVFTNSLPEAFASVTVPPVTAAPWKKFLAFSGLGAMISVGYMDPGNWATGLAGGSQFGYTLLSVILVSNVAAIILQHLALKLGVASGRDLAQVGALYVPGLGSHYSCWYLLGTFWVELKHCKKYSCPGYLS